jgi:hypothetical protein
MLIIPCGLVTGFGFRFCGSMMTRVANGCGRVGY